tara:strand:+ start:28 stop:249 length:222 start_codon:yes stop_codon:yes gene_type:complete
MKKKDLAAIVYVSILIIIWGSVGSLIDYAFLVSNSYKAGSIGQVLTFSVTGFIFSWVGIKIFPFTMNRVLPEE